MKKISVKKAVGLVLAGALALSAVGLPAVLLLRRQQQILVQTKQLMLELPAPQKIMPLYLKSLSSLSALGQQAAVLTEMRAR